jgi:hypothetical protein
MELAVEAVVSPEGVIGLRARQLLGEINRLEIVCERDGLGVGLDALASGERGVGPNGPASQRAAMLAPIVGVGDAPGRAALGRRAFGFNASRLAAERAVSCWETEFWSNDVK